MSKRTGASEGGGAFSTSAIDGPVDEVETEICSAAKFFKSLGPVPLREAALRSRLAVAVNRLAAFFRSFSLTMVTERASSYLASHQMGWAKDEKDCRRFSSERKPNGEIRHISASNRHQGQKRWRVCLHEPADITRTFPYCTEILTNRATGTPQSSLPLCLSA